MCSIGGWVSATPLEGWEANTLTRALVYYGQERGQQSAGVLLQGASTKSRQLVKKAISPQDFVNGDTWASLDFNNREACLIHTRQPTSGGRGDAQAQPFVVAEVATIHNGWYTNTKEIKDTHSIDKPSGVDSELVATFVAAHGIGQLPSFFKTAEGSGAIGLLVGSELHLARSGNPIEWIIINIQDNSVFVFASTEDQVLNSIRHTWLIKPRTRTRMLLPETVFKCNAVAEPVEVVQWESKYRRYTSTMGYHGNHNRTPIADDPNWVKDGATYRYVGQGRSHQSTSTLKTPETPNTPPDIPKATGEQEADFEALSAKAMSNQTLDLTEQARLAYYLLQED